MQLYQTGSRTTRFAQCRRSEYLVPRIRHALHNLFKDVHYYGVASVPRDFVELPSQIDEHWAFEPEVLNVYAKHYQTDEVIPAGLVEKMDKSGKYGQGFATAEYLAASCWIWIIMY